MTLQVINPYDQKIVCERPWDTGPELERKITRAREAFAVWSRLSLKQRARQVRRGLVRFRRDAEIIARDITLQMGKPITQSRREVSTFFERAEYMLEIAEESLSPEVLPSRNGLHRRIEHVPLGLVLNIAAWNYPLLVPVNVVVPALLAGNVVLLKHSAKTPLCGEHFQRAFGELDPPALATSLIITHEQTARLIDDPRINYVALTGSVAAGREVYLRAAGRLLDVGLELGGKDAAYVAEDADMDLTVANVVDGACYNAGQSCCAVERVYVHRKRYRDFLARAEALLGAYRLGDPLSEDTSLGPLANRAALDSLERQVKDAVSRGARLLLGGQRVPDTPGNFFPPTLLADVPSEAEAMQEESFGPVVPVQPVADDHEALARMAESRYGLTASVWTRKRARAERLARFLEAGTVYQNRCDYLDPALPWTGFKDSGLGSTLSRYGLLHLTKRKSLHFKTGR